MKKIVMFIMIMMCPFILMGCQHESDVKDNISEVTNIYFQGESENGELDASISVGQRENPYIIDGIHQKTCDFSLLVLSFNGLLNEDEITINLSVNDTTTELILYFNPLNSTFMNDLGYNLKENDKVSLTYQNYSIDFENISNNFSINFKQAIDIACNELDEEIKNLYSSNVFKGECYLKILSKQGDKSGKLFWIFTVVGQDKSNHNVVISVEDGSIILTD